MLAEVDYSAARFWWDVMQTVGMMALFVWTVLENKRKRNTAGLGELQNDMSELDRRMQRLEDTQAQLPTHHDLTDVKNQMSGLKEKIEAQNGLLQTIHQFLLNDTRNSRPSGGNG